MSVEEVDIKPWKASVNELTVELLEEMLEHAKAGVFQEVLIIGIPEEGGAVSSFSPTLGFIQRLGAIEYIKQRWLHQTLHNENSESPIDSGPDET